MTDQEINQTIAAALGWSKLTKDPAMMVQYTAQMPDGKWGMVPDYCNDLNAMHEAEMLCLRSGSAVERYRSQITTLQSRLVSVEMDLTATARQRAEAFLRTLNLWQS